MRMRNVLMDALLPSINTSSFALGVGTTLLALRYMPELDMEEMGIDIKKRAEKMKERMAEFNSETTEDEHNKDNKAIVSSSPSIEKLQSEISKLQVELNQIKNNAIQ